MGLQDGTGYLGWTGGNIPSATELWICGEHSKVQMSV